MFDDKTQDVIMDEMLDQADPEKDTRPGSIIYDAIGPMAAELEQVYADMGLIDKKGSRTWDFCKRRNVRCFKNKDRTGRFRDSYRE